MQHDLQAVVTVHQTVGPERALEHAEPLRSGEAVGGNLGFGVCQPTTGLVGELRHQRRTNTVEMVGEEPKGDFLIRWNHRLGGWRCAQEGEAFPWGRAAPTHLVQFEPGSVGVGEEGREKPRSLHLAAGNLEWNHPHTDVLGAGAAHEDPQRILARREFHLARKFYPARLWPWVEPFQIDLEGLQQRALQTTVRRDRIGVDLETKGAFLVIAYQRLASDLHHQRDARSLAVPTDRQHQYFEGNGSPFLAAHDEGRHLGL